MADFNDASPSHDRKGMVASEYKTVFAKRCTKLCRSAPEELAEDGHQD